MWICGNCGAEVADQFDLCGWCDTRRENVAEPAFADSVGQAVGNTPLEMATVADAASSAEEVAPPTAVAEPPAMAVGAEAPPPTVPSGPVWEPENKASLSAYEYTRALESRLSSLMDDFDTPDWKVNPAFHPEVNAFIQGHADNAAFFKKAQSLQQNRAKYYATMRAQERPTPPPPAAAPPAAEVPVAAAPVPEPVPVPVPVEEKTRPRRSWRRRIAAWTLFLLLLAVGGVVGSAWYWDYLSQQQLQAVVDTLDETDPDWRGDDALTRPELNFKDRERVMATCAAIERTLVQGTASPEALAATQQLLETEAKQPLLCYVLRGLRARTDVSLEQESPVAFRFPDEENFALTDENLRPAAEWLMQGWWRENRALALVLLTEAVACAQLPLEQQPAAFQQLEKTTSAWRTSGWPEGRYVPGTDAMSAVNEMRQSIHATDMRLRCTIIALAAERYRLVHDRWPNSCADLAEFLPKVPLDIYSGQPLRLKRSEDGIVIFCVAPAGKEIGFRLRDVERRR